MASQPRGRRPVSGDPYIDRLWEIESALGTSRGIVTGQQQPSATQASSSTVPPPNNNTTSNPTAATQPDSDRLTPPPDPPQPPATSQAEPRRRVRQRRTPPKQLKIIQSLPYRKAQLDGCDVRQQAQYMSNLAEDDQWTYLALIHRHPEYMALEWERPEDPEHSDWGAKQRSAEFIVEEAAEYGDRYVKNLWRDLFTPDWTWGGPVVEPSGQGCGPRGEKDGEQIW